MRVMKCEVRCHGEGGREGEGMIPLNKKMRLSHLWYLFEVVEDNVRDVHSPSPSPPHNNHSNPLLESRVQILNS